MTKKIFIEKAIEDLILNPQFSSNIAKILYALREENYTGTLSNYLFEAAHFVREKYYKNHVYLRGLIEFSNFCKNDCFYCGIRRSNHQAIRYRLSLKDILLSCEIGYNNGLRTFVLQGGEDLYFTTEKFVEIIKAIRQKYPDCAITLSIGEKDTELYEQCFLAGANRFLLRHETINPLHYTKLHPSQMSQSHRLKCLHTLKNIGYQVGAGMMIGSPQQTLEHLLEDLSFLFEFQPHMVGIGPFIPHKQTPFAKQSAGSVELTLVILALVRLLLPKVLLPATTALASLTPDGTIRGLKAGANVIMPNISPVDIRKLYTLYNNKKITGGESLEGIIKLKQFLNQYGYEVPLSRGDSLID